MDIKKLFNSLMFFLILLDKSNCQKYLTDRFPIQPSKHKFIYKHMLWKRHLSLYTNSEKKGDSETKKESHKRTSLMPLLSTGKVNNNNQTIETNQTKFTIRKKSKSNKLSKQLLVNSFFLHKGNNHLLIKRVLESLALIEVYNKQTASIIWYQGKDHPKKDFLQRDLTPKFSNYLPNHSEITNKQKLYENISKFYPQSVNKFIPKSYIIDFRDNLVLVESNLVEFLSDFFRKNKITKTSKKNNSFFISNYYGEICILFSRVFKNMNEQRKQLDGKFQIKQQENNGPCLWIVKPAFLNRGQGIEVISTLKQLEKMLSEDNQQISIKLYQSEEKQGPSCYIIQQYIMNPLLFEGYKFDMRVWIMLRKTRKNGPEVYIYRKGYVRLATHKYTNEPIIQESQELNHEEKYEKYTEYPSPNRNKKSSNRNPNSNRFVHLTNNAIQKNCKDYGILYEGNQLSISEMVEHLKIPEITEQYLFLRFIEITTIMIESCKDKLFAKSSNGNFMLIGMDFLIDKAYNVWLIEANCNPCMEQSSPFLKQWLPEMLQQMLTIMNVQKLGKGGNKEQTKTQTGNLQKETIINEKTQQQQQEYWQRII